MVEFLDELLSFLDCWTPRRHKVLLYSYCWQMAMVLLEWLMDSIPKPRTSLAWKTIYEEPANINLRLQGGTSQRCGVGSTVQSFRLRFGFLGQQIIV